MKRAKTSKELVAQIEAKFAPKGRTEIEAGKVYHTPTPWQVTHLRHGSKFTNAFRIGSGPFGEIALTSATAAEEENMANAQFICSAVNCHDELVGVIEAYIEMHLLHRLAMPETNENEGKRWKRTLDNAQAILSKAKGEA